MCLPLLLAAFRTSGDRGRFEYAAAPINVNETAEKHQAASGAITPFLNTKQP
jgi:hypothetical protein